MPENETVFPQEMCFKLKKPNGDEYTEIFSGLTIRMPKPTDVKGVWFNRPHTTVRWGDDVTTTVTCGDGDMYDPMLGFLLCVAKRHFGNTGKYLEVMRANDVPEQPKPTTIEIDVSKADNLSVDIVCSAWNEA